jgi:hypothetical protein
MNLRRNVVSRLIREPLLHFLLLGAGLFLLYAYVGDDRPEPADLVVVDETEIQRLAEQFQRTWMRPPTRQELEGLTEDFVKEEILYREALALGLDRDDLVIRRRMRQKMEFLNADLVDLQEPSQAELQAYLDANPDKFRRSERVSFQQIYFNPERPEGAARQRAEELLENLKVQPATAIDSLGDPTLLPPQLAEATAADIDGVFGRGFAAHIQTLSADAWAGPFESAYGLYLVRLNGRVAGGLPTLSDVRQLVEREWTAERRRESDQAFYQALRQRYRVELEMPEQAPGDVQAAARPW